MKCKKLIFVLYLFMLFFFSNVINLNAAGWGFTKNPNHTTPEIGKYKLMIEDTSSYYVGETTQILPLYEIIISFTSSCFRLLV